MKKTYLCLGLMLISLHFYGQNCNIGNDTKTSDFTSGILVGNTLSGVKFTVSGTSTLNSINLVGNDTGSAVRMAVYDDEGGPNNLIASATGTVGAGITSLPVTPTEIAAGDYWVMAIYEVDGYHTDRNRLASGNIVYYKNHDYNDPLPDPGSGFVSYVGTDFLYFLGLSGEGCNILSSDSIVLENDVLITPNPSADFITISHLKNTEHYSIINELGQEIKKGTVANHDKINIQDLAHGFYFLKIEHSNHLTKILKK